MRSDPDVLCIGSVLWDTIGLCRGPLAPGDDQPGSIRRIPGGVAMNVALGLAARGHRPALLSCLGEDADGELLVREAERHGILADYIHRDPELPTDNYMAIETSSGLLAALADATSLERAGAAILAPLRDGRLGAPQHPWAGVAIVDGNLTEALLAEMVTDPALSSVDLRVAPASPGKAARLRVLLTHPRATLYVNRGEAELIMNQGFRDTAHAARGLCRAGAWRASVTDGAAEATIAQGDMILCANPPSVAVKRVTGAGDAFMAGHIAAELGGDVGQQALNSGLQSAADHICRETS